MAKTQVKPDQTSTTVTVDANGWSYDSEKREWTYFTSGSSGSIASLANYNPPNVPLPVGVSNVNLLNYHAHAQFPVRVFTLADVTPLSATAIVFNISNWYSSAFTLSYYGIHIVARLR